MNPLANLQPVNLAGTTQNALLQGLQVGDAMRQRKQQEMQSQAMDNAYRGAMSGNANAFNELANVPGMAKNAYGLQQAQRTAQTQQADAQRQQLGKVADLLDNSTDEQSYQRNLGAARQLGLDVSSAPANFDPNFIKTQTAIARAVLGNDPELPLIGQEVMLRGFQPGTPEFQAEIGRILTAKYDPTKVISYQQGGGAGVFNPATNTMTPLVVPGNQQQQPVTKVVNGNTYYQVDGQWYDELPQGGSVGNGTGGF